MSSTYHIARDGVRVYVRVEGLANMKNAPMLDAFLSAEESSRLEVLCIDLEGCTGMDSTFMGLLVGTSGTMRASAAAGQVVLVNPSETCRKLLDMLGVSQVVTVVARTVESGLSFVPLGEGNGPVGNLQRMEVIRRAHHALSDLSEGNRIKFSAFLAALEADLVKHRPQY